MLKVCHAGRFGDALWALPVVRHLAKLHGPVQLHLPVDPANTTPMKDLAPLLERQPYIAEVIVRQDWSIEWEAPRRPTAPPDWIEGWEAVSLSWTEWPTQPLPFYAAGLVGLTPTEVDWSPWITVEHRVPPLHDVLYTWSDRWFELKFGLSWLTWKATGITGEFVCQAGSRWDTEGHVHQHVNIPQLAEEIAVSRLLVTDCSMAHVLAAAIGTPCVVVEPEEARHHWIFWPGSVQDSQGHWQQADNAFGRLIYPVIGGDGKPTFDARHTADLIKEVLSRA